MLASDNITVSPLPTILADRFHKRIQKLNKEQSFINKLQRDE